MAKWVIADEREEDAESTSEEEEEEAEAEDDEVGEEEDAEEEPAAATASTGPSSVVGPSPTGTMKQRKLKIKLGGGDVCHVCGKKGHMAGFIGAKYIDCPNKPCYLCGKQGHSTMTCPFRIAPGHGCTAAAGVSSDTVLSALRKREQGGRPPPLQAPATRHWQVDAAVLKLHSRRTTCLEFHPTLDHLVLSGDKRGQIAVWDHQKVYERTVYPNINRWLTNMLRFMPGSGDSCASSSYDGTVKVFDVETGCASTLFDANPQGWDHVEAEEAAGSWITMMGMDVIRAANAVVAGDNFGCLHFLDPRMQQPITSLQLHKRSSGKVQSVHCNPVDGNLVISAGNDYTAQVLDIRNLMAGTARKGKGAVGSEQAHGVPAVLSLLQHSKVINAAYFSPITGRKILTTSQDNRLRVWDYLYTTQQPADREIVHSQNFNRYLSPFKAEWDPKDPAERLIVCGRYISEDFEGLALHPVDLLDASTGALVGELTDPNLTTISPVNKPHPRLDLIVSGSSRSLYAWRPVPEEEEEVDEGGGRSGQRKGGSGSGGEGGPPLKLKGSSTYIFFDADPDEKSKGKKGGKAVAASPSTAGGGMAADAPLSVSGKSGGKGRGKGKAAGSSSVAAVAVPDEGEDGEPGTSSKGHKRGGGPAAKGSSGGSGGGKWQRKGQREEQGEDDNNDFV